MFEFILLLFFGWLSITYTLNTVKTVLPFGEWCLCKVIKLTMQSFLLEALDDKYSN